MIKIIVDNRELRSGVAKALDTAGADLTITTCEVGDYILSDRCAAERKATDDFLSSMFLEKKLFGQLISLANAYERPLLFIEGDPMAIYTTMRINPKAIDGVLRAIMVSLRIPIVWTLNAKETAGWLIHIAEKEQDTGEKRVFNPHGKRSSLSLPEQQEYVVSAVSGIGILTARDLLRHFGSVQECFSAGVESLMKVDGIGKKTAEAIREVVGSRYLGEK